MQATLFLPKVHDGQIDLCDFGLKLRSAIVEGFGRYGIGFRYDHTKQFPIRFRRRSNPQPKLVISAELLTSGYIADFYQGGIGIAIQEVFRERGIHEDIPGCEIELSITMKTSLVL